MPPRAPNVERGRTPATGTSGRVGLASQTTFTSPFAGQREGSSTVPFVEDEPLIAMSAEEMLSEMGYAVVTARTGREAIELFQLPPHPDVVITDNRLPDMLGWEVLRRCRDLDPTVAAVMASGDPERSDRACRNPDKALQQRRGWEG